jgi:alpha-amylase
MPSRPLLPLRLAARLGFALLLAPVIGGLEAVHPLHAARAQGHPSPEDWRDVTVYQIVTDRFFDGDPSNDDLEGVFAPTESRGVHGGDYAGLIEKLDYIEGLGMDAVWISPVVLNSEGEFHGYAAHDHFAYCPTKGGLTSLRAFVDAAHARGIYVLIDIVAGHMGDAIDSGDPGYPDYDPNGYTLRWKDPTRRHAPPFDDLSWYHNYGHITNFTREQEERGELFGLDDLATERQDVRDTMAAAYSQMVVDTDCDGFRVDTVKHVDIGFWQDFMPRIRQTAASVGKDNFLLLGEVWDGAEHIGRYTGTMAGGPYLCDSATWFPMNGAARYVFSGEGSPSTIAHVYGDSLNYDPTVRGRLGNFFDNHDMGRLAAREQANQDDTLLRAAITWLLTSPGIPILYYGTEQEFDGGEDPYNREDMWDGAWTFGPSLGDSFDMMSPLYRHVRMLQALRHAHPALRRGALRIHQADPAPGILAYSRDDPSSPAGDVVVAINTSLDSLTTRSLPSRWSGGTAVMDVLHPQRAIEVRSGGWVTLRLSARSSAILVASGFEPPLTVETTSPPHDGTLRRPRGEVRIVFDRAMQTSAAGRVTLDPPVAFVPHWDDDRTLVLNPVEGWPADTMFTVEVDRFAEAVDGASLGVPFTWHFATLFDDAGLTLASGFSVEVIEPFGMNQPEALEVVPRGWTARGPWVELPLVSDVSRGRILQANPAQRVTTFGLASELQWGTDTIHAMDRDENGTYGGALVLVSDDAAWTADGSGRMERLEYPGARFRSVHVGTHTLAGLIFFAMPTWDLILRLQDGSLESWCTGLTNPHGMDQPPAGSGLPDWIYVCDPDLGGAGTGAIYRVDGGGTPLRWVDDPGVRGVMSIAFAPTGPFGQGNLYALDALGERVLRIGPTGSVTVFAEGFENLYGSDALAFGPEGDLYVLDPGNSVNKTVTKQAPGSPRLLRIHAESATVVPPLVSSRLAMLPARPNPFNPRTTLAFDLPSRQQVKLAVYDAAGRHLTDLVDDVLEPGRHQRTWTGVDSSGRELASGVYFVRLQTPQRSLTQKVVLVR